MYYLNPNMLYLIPVVGLSAALLVLAAYWRSRLIAKRVGEWNLLGQTSNPLNNKLFIARGVFAAMATGLLVFALARPIIPDGESSIQRGTVDVVSVVDVSRSMAAMDYEGKVPAEVVATRGMEFDDNPLSIAEQLEAMDPDREKQLEDAGTRLEMVRHLMLNNLLKVMDGNQFGVVSYAGEAFPQSFLTNDSKTLSWVIDRGLTISSAPGEGSSIGKALELALAMFDADSPEDHERLIVVFSDGGFDNEKEEAERVQNFIKLCRERKIRLLVLGMGNYMPAKIPVSKLAHDDPYAQGLLHNGKRWYEVNGQIEKTKMNEPFLMTLANQTGGQYMRLENFEDLNLHDYVGKKVLENVEGSQELFQWALLGSFLFMFLYVASYHKFRKREDS